MPFELTTNVTVDRDEAGQAHHLEHLQQPYRADTHALAAPTPQTLVGQYLNEPEVKRAYGLTDEMVRDLTGAGFRPAVGTVLTGQDGSRLNLAAGKSVLGTTTVSCVQTYRGLPVWEAGISATALDNPPRVTSSQSSVPDRGRSSLPASAPVFYSLPEELGFLSIAQCSARLLPFCEAEDDKMLSCLVAAPARYAAGARAYRIIFCKRCESFENSWGSVCVCKPHCAHNARRTHVSLAENVTVALPLQKTALRVLEERGS
jgi:hypothetical protein